MKVPYKEYRKITSKQQLEDYIKEIDDGLLIYGEPKYTKSPFNNEDALLIVFDEKGKQVKLKFAYYMTPEGHRYRLNKKNEKIRVSENKGRVYGLRLLDGSIKGFQVHHLQLWSYYPHLDWKPFCENIQNNGGNNDATVDHIKQEHTACHYKYLEAVPQSENVRRSNRINDKERALRQAQSQGKPFIMKLDEEQIGDVFHSTYEAVKYLSKEHDIMVYPSSISACLNGRTKTAYYERITCTYTEEYLNSQKDLDDEIWKTLDECCQKDAIIKRYKRMQNVIPPKAISNKGRIKTNMGKKTNGIRDKGNNHSTFNSVDLSMLVWETFSEEVIGNLFLLHDDKHHSNTFDEKTGKVIRYSNWFETLRLGTQQENMEEMSREMQRVAELDPKNEFIVRDKEGIEVMRSFYPPDCADKLNKKYPGKRVGSSKISTCLKKKLKTHQGFTFKFVIPRT